MREIAILPTAPALDQGFEREACRRLGGVLHAGTADAHGRLTLDDLITGVWEGLAVRGTVSCPVCASPMASRPTELGGDVRIGACLGCGSRIS
jgi:hypothetical protein